MFRSATFRLTAWYVLILAIICLLFSVAFYRVATGELAESLRRESHRIIITQQFPPQLAPSVDQSQIDIELSSGSHRILMNLLVFDGMLLLAGSIASFFLAKRTLAPIEVAHEAQKRFASDASHELRTPLTSMKTEIEVMLREKSPTQDDMKGLLRSNLEEVGRLESMASSLLKLARYDEGLASSLHPTDLDDAVRTAVKQLARAAKQQRVKVQTDLRPAQVLGDPGSLTELTVILLENAIKYSSADSIVKVSTGIVDGLAEIKIADQGAGISAEALPHVFERFYREDDSRTKQKVEGHGLGLALAQSIAHLHRGTIELQSAEGVGTTAIVRLPSVQEDATAESAQA